MKSIILMLGFVTVVISQDMMAVVKLTPNDPSNNVTGYLKIVQNYYGTLTITGEVYGLNPGLHGMHVHEKGDLSDGCTSAGEHFNPENLTHGGPTDAKRHVGDLGNIKTTPDGCTQINISENLISLRGPYSIIGRAIVVHSGQDDLGKGGNESSSVSGNSGSRLCCGVIGIAYPVGSLSSTGSLIFINHHGTAILLFIISLLVFEFNV